LDAVEGARAHAGDISTGIPGAAAGRAPMRSRAGLCTAIREHRRAALVVNTRSRRGRRLYPAVAARLQTAGFNLLGSFPVDQRGQLGASLATAIDLQPDLLILGGGDGSISEAARRLAYRDMAMGILPLGTTNNFARTLGVPLNVAGAIGVLTIGNIADVDLGRADDTIFANLVSAGLSAHVAANLPHHLERLLGRAAYPVTAPAGLPWHQPFHASITAGDRHYTLDTHQLNIANGSFHAGRPITGDASADDRLLLIYRLGGTGRRALINATIRHVVLGLLGSLRFRLAGGMEAMSETYRASGRCLCGAISFKVSGTLRDVFNCWAWWIAWLPMIASAASGKVCPVNDAAEKLAVGVRVGARGCGPVSRGEFQPTQNSLPSGSCMTTK
jgi:diacylglycerol kinase family enzyme